MSVENVKNSGTSGALECSVQVKSADEFHSGSISIDYIQSTSSRAYRTYCWDRLRIKGFLMPKAEFQNINIDDLAAGFDKMLIRDLPNVFTIDPSQMITWRADCSRKEIVIDWREVGEGDLRLRPRTKCAKPSSGMP